MNRARPELYSPTGVANKQILKISPHWADRRGAHPLAIGNFDREVTTIREPEIDLCDNRLRIRGGPPAIRWGVLVESGGALFISAFLDIVRRRGERIYGGCSSGEALVPFGRDAVFSPPRMRREDAVPEKAQAGIRQLDLARHSVFWIALCSKSKIRCLSMSRLVAPTWRRNTGGTGSPLQRKASRYKSPALLVRMQSAVGATKLASKSNIDVAKRAYAGLKSAA